MKLPTRSLNGAVCFVGLFLVGLSFVGMTSAISAASVIEGASESRAYPAIKAAEKVARNQWLWCRIAGGVIVVLSIGIDLRLSRQADGCCPSE